MATITFIEHDGTEHTIEAQEGISVMQNAVDNEVPGIDADCGGACACATCHVLVPQQWLEKTGKRSPMEEAMLQLAEGVADNSRLSCQIDMSAELDGLTVQLPESQH
ncbi:MAG: 2Fe-2S iron-sulfur cluster binding domain-containing protein [Halieaceae bacterium]|nr:2Fe-2S iron-sulfur cluster binding domain-containing protein [Halieaceae bacterium]